jgi:hypothetical protein
MPFLQFVMLILRSGMLFLKISMPVMQADAMNKGKTQLL